MPLPFLPDQLGPTGLPSGGSGRSRRGAVRLSDRCDRAVIDPRATLTARTRPGGTPYGASLRSSDGSARRAAATAFPRRHADWEPAVHRSVASCPPADGGPRSLNVQPRAPAAANGARRPSVAAAGAPGGPSGRVEIGIRPYVKPRRCDGAVRFGRHRPHSEGGTDGHGTGWSRWDRRCRPARRRSSWSRRSVPTTGSDTTSACSPGSTAPELPVNRWKAGSSRRHSIRTAARTRGPRCRPRRPAPACSTRCSPGRCGGYGRAPSRAPGGPAGCAWSCAAMRSRCACCRGSCSTTGCSCRATSRWSTAGRWCARSAPARGHPRRRTPVARRAAHRRTGRR